MTEFMIAGLTEFDHLALAALIGDGTSTGEGLDTAGGGEASARLTDENEFTGPGLWRATFQTTRPTVV